MSFDATSFTILGIPSYFFAGIGAYVAFLYLTTFFSLKKWILRPKQSCSMVHSNIDDRKIPDLSGISNAWHNKKYILSESKNALDKQGKRNSEIERKNTSSI